VKSQAASATWYVHPNSPCNLQGDLSIEGTVRAAGLELGHVSCRRVGAQPESERCIFCVDRNTPNTSCYGIFTAAGHLPMPQAGRRRGAVVVQPARRLNLKGTREWEWASHMRRTLNETLSTGDPMPLPASDLHQRAAGAGSGHCGDSAERQKRSHSAPGRPPRATDSL